MTELVAQAYQTIPDKSKAIILCENYGQAGAISIIGKKYNLPTAYSFSDSYLYWNPPAFEPEIEYIIFTHNEMWNGLGSVFDDKKIFATLTNKNAREGETNIYILKNPTSSFNEYWKDVLEELNGD